MNAMARKVLTTEQIADANRLKRIWNRQKTPLNLTQEKVCEHMGWSSQSSFSQYLNGKIALNLPAVVRLAQVLEVRPAEISPTLAKDLEQDFGRGIREESGAYLSNPSSPAIGRLQALFDRGVLTEGDLELLEHLVTQLRQTDLSD